ncbi:receptor-like cytosolic serine/threonine-protein kinase RBK2 isoform X2 [Quercus robur]|uniref:receptor-like cytosolic serine/threonine-protein kinase RBK2 isoform X2 n=1 Tax=Quercus robur TaxID=38942 RepID=UPI00216116E2|nr:receptor-like cytosolic serine/threonine-protein kinase RBK2 isoform X2 [Quercus robur]
MEKAGEPSASSCNGSHDIDTENQEWEANTSIGRRPRAGFSDSFSSHDMEGGMYESSPRGVLEGSSRSLESDTASPGASTSDSEGNQDPGSSTRWNGFFHMLKKGPNVSFQKWKSVPKLTRRKSKRIREEMVPALRPSIDGELCYFKSCWRNFTLSELEAATNNFSHDNLIGEGGYAEVYKGALEDGQLVAIKRLTRGTQEEMTADFLSELGVIVHVDHPNIAKLIGYGVEGGMHLVLELSPHGSLASILYGPREKLDWGIRHKIALGIAEGLVYLHEGCHRRIIHKDIKASNILLAEDFEPQISDFGLAKWLPDQWTHHTVSNFEGTFGYLPPEYFMHGIVDEKTDVYSYGVLILELITGRKALDSSQQSLVMWAKPLLSKNCILELVDPFLVDAYDTEEMNRMALTASLCIHQSSIHRPQMSEVEKILKGDAHTLASIKQCQQSKFQRTYSEELTDAEEYNSTKYLKDLGRYREIVLGLSNDAQNICVDNNYDFKGA